MGDTVSQALSLSNVASADGYSENLDVAFGELGLHKVWLMVFQTNERSRRTWTRLGFLEEGVLRDEYFHEGTWRNMVRMGLLEDEWRAKQHA